MKPLTVLAVLDNSATALMAAQVLPLTITPIHVRLTAAR
jgi:hypothetical protein